MVDAAEAKSREHRETRFKGEEVKGSQAKEDLLRSVRDFGFFCKRNKKPR